MKNLFVALVEFNMWCFVLKKWYRQEKKMQTTKYLNYRYILKTANFKIKKNQLLKKTYPLDSLFRKWNGS